MIRRFINIVVVTLVAITIFSPSAEASTNRELKKLKRFIKVLDKEYIDELDYHYLVEVAIRSILDEVDPYSTYLNVGESGELSTIIESPAIDTAYMLDSSTAVIKLSVFSHNAAVDIENTYINMRRPENLILDLRGNKGGLVVEAIKTTNFFLEKGVPIFRRDRRGKPIYMQSTKYDGDMLSTNVIVVIDRESASASEIVAAALQYNKRALIVGERSFGKGLIIRPFKLPDNSFVWIATSQYTTPIGGKIQRSYRGRESSDQDGGVTPDIKFYSNELIAVEDFIIFGRSND